METFSALLAICAGNSPVPGEFPTQRPVTRSFDVYFDLRPNKWLSKQSWGWWFESLSWSLSRQRNVTPPTDGVELSGTGGILTQNDQIWGLYMCRNASWKVLFSVWNLQQDIDEPLHNIPAITHAGGIIKILSQLKISRRKGKITFSQITQGASATMSLTTGSFFSHICDHYLTHAITSVVVL